MIDAITKALASITNPRFYETERGFQGAFLASLEGVIPNAALPGGAIVEQEYQKRLQLHGIKLRPDIIVHVPTPIGGIRSNENFIVFELKLAASGKEAQGDFESLDSIIAALDYPIGVFINIAAEETYAEEYTGPFRHRMQFFAVRLAGERVLVRHAYFNGMQPVEEELDVTQE
jgi:hypothetical protein